ncbi:MAG: LamG domain-containing protein [Candidatus Nanohaloarchaea archaeon]|nr:LamG domain-containing protein [Candidatus Nanohaloarchaea archaeon]
MDARAGVSALVSMVIYTGIVVAAAGIALNVGAPIIDRMQDTAAITNSIDFLRQVDAQVEEVTTEGQYSAREVRLTFDRGRYVFDNTTGELSYKIDTTSNFIAAHAAQRRGNLLISSEADVSVRESSVNGTDCYMMENQHLKACVRKLPKGFDPANHPELAAFWRLDEGSGQWANDSSQYGTDATLGADATSGADDPAWTAGVHGEALQFDGSDDAVNASRLAATSPQLTVTAWVNASPVSGDRAAVSVGDYAVVEPVSGGGAGAARYWTGSGWESTSFSTAVDDASWHHVAYVVDSAHDEQRVYVDGALEATTTHTANLTFDNALHNWTTLGVNASGGEHWSGDIDAVRVYNRTLTGEEVEWTYLQRGDVNHINTSELLVSYHNKDLDTDLDPTLTVLANGRETTITGTGHATAERLGGTLGRGRVTATVKSDYGLNYDIHIDLLSGADFLKVSAVGR